MNCPKCPYCSSHATARLTANTSLGYPTFRCSQCKRKFNERTGTVYNHLQFPTDIVLLVVLWRLRDKGYTACETWSRSFWSEGSRSLTRR
jgi:transposase-like protein